MREIFEIIENMQLVELWDELELLDGHDSVEANLIREIIYYEINKRKKGEMPKYIIVEDFEGRAVVVDTEDCLPIERYATKEEAERLIKVLSE